MKHFGDEGVVLLCGLYEIHYYESFSDKSIKCK